MQLEIIQAEMGTHSTQIRELFREYLLSLDPLFERDFGVTFDMDAILEGNMEELYKLMPPYGRILFAHVDSQLAGCVCLRRISEDLSEVKRMYVRPQHRRRGIGRALVEALISQARVEGCIRLRLDSAPFLPESHNLYHSLGFKPTPPYADSEIPESYHARWVFMELHLTRPSPPN